MNSELLMSLFEQYGYAIFFFSLCLGLIGPPVPNEAVALTAGALAAGDLVGTVPAFAATYLGALSGITFSYTLGRYAAHPLLLRLKKRKRTRRYLEAAERGIERHGLYAFPLCYFVPAVRHLISYLFGASRMPFRRYAVAAYLTGTIWSAVYFTLGYFVADSAGGELAKSGFWLAALALVVAAGVLYARRRYFHGRRSRDGL